MYRRHKDRLLLQVIQQPNLSLHKPSETAQTGLTCQPEWLRSCVFFFILSWLIIPTNLLRPLRCLWLCSWQRHWITVTTVQSHPKHSFREHYWRVTVNVLSPFRRALFVISEDACSLNHVNRRGATIVARVAARVWRQTYFVSAKAGGKNKEKGIVANVAVDKCSAEREEENKP